MLEKTARCVTTAVKKLMSPEEDDEETEYDRADDLVNGEWLLELCEVECARSINRHL